MDEEVKSLPGGGDQPCFTVRIVFSKSPLVLVSMNAPQGLAAYFMGIGGHLRNNVILDIKAKLL